MLREEVEKSGLLSRQRAVELDTLNPVNVFGCASEVLGHSLILLIDGQSSLRAGLAFEDDPVG